MKSLVFIRLNIECQGEGYNHVLAEANPDIEQPTEFRPGFIQLSDVMSFYPSQSGGTIFHMYTDVTYTVKKSLSTIDKMLKNTPNVDLITKPLM